MRIGSLVFFAFFIANLSLFACDKEDLLDTHSLETLAELAPTITSSIFFLEPTEDFSKVIKKAASEKKILTAKSTEALPPKKKTLTTKSTEALPPRKKNSMAKSLSGKSCKRLLKHIHLFSETFDREKDIDIGHFPFLVPPKENDFRFISLQNTLEGLFPETKLFLTPTQVKNHLHFIALQANRIILWQLFESAFPEFHGKNLLPQTYCLFSLFKEMPIPDSHTGNKRRERFLLKVKTFVSCLYEDQSLFSNRFYTAFSPPFPDSVEHDVHNARHPLEVFPPHDLDWHAIFAPKITHIKDTFSLFFFKERELNHPSIKKFIESGEYLYEGGFLVFLSPLPFNKWETQITSSYPYGFSQEAEGEISTLLTSACNTANLCLTHYFYTTHQTLLASEKDPRGRLLSILSHDHMQTKNWGHNNEKPPFLPLFFLERAYADFEVFLNKHKLDTPKKRRKSSGMLGEEKD